MVKRLPGEDRAPTPGLFEPEVAMSMPAGMVMCIVETRVAAGPSTTTDRGARRSARRRQAIAPRPGRRIAERQTDRVTPSVNWTVIPRRARKELRGRATTAQCEARAAARPGAEAPIVQAVEDFEVVEGDAGR